MVWRVLKYVAAVSAVGFLLRVAYVEGHRSALSETRDIDRKLTVMDYRVNTLYKSYSHCLEVANFYRGSAASANRLLTLGGFEDADYGGIEY